jgi:hypothetical protein
LLSEYLSKYYGPKCIAKLYEIQNNYQRIIKNIQAKEFLSEKLSLKKEMEIELLDIDILEKENLLVSEMILDDYKGSVQTTAKKRKLESIFRVKTINPLCVKEHLSVSFKLKLTATTDFFLIIKGEVQQKYIYDEDIKPVYSEDVKDFEVEKDLHIEDKAKLSIVLQNETASDFTIIKKMSNFQLKKLGCSRESIFDTIQGTIKTILEFTNFKNNAMEKKITGIFERNTSKSSVDTQSKEQIIRGEYVSQAKKIVEKMISDPGILTTDVHDPENYCYRL